MNCIFCKITNKEFSSSIVYENDDVIAILDLSQAKKGHTLVMPKAHYDNILEVPSDIYEKLMKAVQIVAKGIDNAFHPDGINIINNCREAAGQTVMHTHVHIIPRYKNDGIKLEFTSNEGKYNLDEIKELIKSAI